MVNNSIVFILHCPQHEVISYSYGSGAYLLDICLVWKGPNAHWSFYVLSEVAPFKEIAPLPKKLAFNVKVTNSNENIMTSASELFSVYNQINVEHITRHANNSIVFILHCP